MAPFGTVEYTSSKRINVWTKYPLKERQEFYQIPATIQPAVPLMQRNAMGKTESHQTSCKQVHRIAESTHHPQDLDAVVRIVCAIRQAPVAPSWFLLPPWQRLLAP